MDAIYLADWSKNARCRGSQPDEMFTQGAAQNRAKAVCMGCPVRTECLADALDNRVEFGVWGGMTERERRALLKRRPDVSSWRALLEEARRELSDKASTNDEQRQLAAGSSDPEIFERLMQCGFEGPTWLSVKEVIAEYCYSVLEGWLYTNEVFDQCKRKGWGLARPPFPLTSQEIEDLTAEVVAAGINRFRNRSLEGKGWEPSGGASLKTWLVGDCLFCFPNLWRRFLGKQKTERKEAHEVLLGSWSIDQASTIDIEATAILKDEVERALAKAQPGLRKVLRLISLGYSHGQICEILGDEWTPRSIEGQLYRLRARLREDGGNR